MTDFTIALALTIGMLLAKFTGWNTFPLWVSFIPLMMYAYILYMFNLMCMAVATVLNRVEIALPIAMRTDEDEKEKPEE